MERSQATRDQFSHFASAASHDASPRCTASPLSAFAATPSRSSRSAPPCSPLPRRRSTRQIQWLSSAVLVCCTTRAQICRVRMSSLLHAARRHGLARAIQLGGRSRSLCSAAAAPSPAFLRVVRSQPLCSAIRIHSSPLACTRRAVRSTAQRWSTTATAAPSAPSQFTPQPMPTSEAATASGNNSSSGGDSSSSSSSSSSSGHGTRNLLLVLAGASVGLYLWSRTNVAGEGAVVAPVAAPAVADSTAEDDPLADHKLPPLIKEHRQLGWASRLFFYCRLSCRALLLSWVWIPVLLSGLILPQRLWMRMVVRLLERCGAVFIKLGQWAATRPDLFPAEVCQALSKLQAACRPHSFAKTMESCRSNFGTDLRAPDGSTLLVEEQVLGSGSMGQVHHGYIVSPDGASRREVAIKVLHPGIHDRVNLDLTLLYFVAAAITRIPYSELQWVSIPEMLIQFTEFMGSHLDLVQEGRNMDRFRRHFRDQPNIQFPAPVYPFVGPQVLVQELAHGIPLGQFMHAQEFDLAREAENDLLRSKNLSIRERITKQHLVAQEEHARKHGDNPDGAPPPPSAAAGLHEQSSPLHSEIARLGLQMYLHMLIEDNFVHSDLHPGNLLVAFPSAGPLQGEGSNPERYNSMSSEHLRSEHVSLVVLDSGLVSELTPRNRRNFLSLFGALILRDGRLAARLMLADAPKHDCTDPQALQEDMHVIVSAIPLENLASVDLGRLLSEVMNCVRRHHVKLESDFASLVISLAIIEGIGRTMDPQLSLFHQAVPVMIKNRECRNILIQTAGLKACLKLGIIVAKEELQLLTHKE